MADYPAACFSRLRTTFHLIEAHAAKGAQYRPVSLSGVRLS